MNDPDKGSWTYQYNMVGELVSQTDPRGYSTTIYRDNLGRINKKVTKQGSSTIETTQSIYAGHQLTQEYIVGSPYKQCFGYDNLGRNHTVTTILDGQGCHDSSEQNILNKKYTQRTTFDQYNRVFQQLDPSGDSKGIENIYNSQGYRYKQIESRNSASANPAVLSEILAMDAQGNITSSKGANGKITSKTYHPITGLVNDIYTHGGAIQNIEYQYDGVGNLRKRNNIASNINQTFTYDSVNRLTNVAGYQPVSLTYSANGNILTKSDLQNGATYTYANTSTGVAGSHALTSVGSLDFQYDVVGNQTHAFDNNVLTREITYSHISKPTLIDDQNDSTTAFIYNSSGDRYKRTDIKKNSSGQLETTTTYYVGNIEVITLPSGVIETKRYVSNAVQTTRTNGTSQTSYLYYDNLGSINAITNEQGQLITRLYFDAFGQKSEIAKASWSATSQAIGAITLVNLSDITTKGYTGHEHLDSFNLIHMNGRVYDPVTGRFIQADPQVQQGNNSQNLNRYSYVINNPLRYTDPSGYNFLDLAAKWMPTILAVVVAVSPAGPIAGGALAGWVGSGFSLKGAAIGAISGAIFSGVGDVFQGKGFFTEGGLGHIATHSVVGGVMSAIQGGKFGHGFISAGLTKAINVNKILPGINEGLNSARVALAAVIGGSISALTGGKFANGAVTAAIAQAYNGNSFWDKAKELGGFVKAVGKAFLPGADLLACVANGCGYIEWGLAVGDVLSSFTPGGAAVRLYKAYKAGASHNKLRKMQNVPSSCFVAGTLIHTSEGLKPIEDIKVGDMVASKNDQTGETDFKPVVQLFRHEDKTVLNLIFETQDGEEEFIQATPEHPFMLETGQWKNAGQLLPGDTVQTNKNQMVKVKSVATDSQRHNVYNFEVQGFHTYFVGEAGVWVHNDCKGVQKYEVGTFEDLQRRSVIGDKLDIHHVGQKHPMNQVVEGYDPKTAPSIALPKQEHKRIPNLKGSYEGTARDLLANDIRNLRNKTNTPNASLKKLIQLNKTKYPTAFKK